MEQLGYEARGENGIKGRRYFQKAEMKEPIMFIFMKKAIQKLIGIYGFEIICVLTLMQRKNTKR